MHTKHALCLCNTVTEYPNGTILIQMSFMLHLALFNFVFKHLMKYWSLVRRKVVITKTRLFKYIENFTTINIENFQIKNPDNFHISAQNINCGYPLEPPRRGGSKKYPQSIF